MATVVTRYVDPNSAPGGDGTTNALSGANCAYQSLFAWEAARQRNLTTADEIERVICSSDDAGSTHAADTTAVNITGWTCDATRYIEIVGATPPGAKWNDNIYRLVVTAGANSTYGITVGEDYVRLVGLQAKVVAGTYTGCEVVKPSSSTGFSVRRCLLILDTNSSGYICDTVLASGPSVFENCLLIVIGGASATTWRGLVMRISGDAARNCTLIGKGTGTTTRGYWSYTSGYATVTNCIVRGFADGFYSTAFNSASDYNSSNISGDAPNTGGSGNNNAQSPWYSGATADSAIFVDATNNDYHLLSDAIFIGVGVDLSGSFSDDIDGVTRTGTWDIGADEYVAAGGSTYNEALTLAFAADLTRSGILSAINALILAVASGQDQSGGMTLTEALTLAIASGQGQSGGMTFEEAVSFAISAISVQSATTEMSTGLSLGITADQGSGSTAEMDATIALSLVAAILQSESVEGAPQTYDELVTMATNTGMSQSTVGSLQEALTLAATAGIGLTSQAIMVNALILQIVSLMDGSFSVFVITTGNKLQFVFKKRKDHFIQ